jgi:hypothetical protein
MKHLRAAGYCNREPRMWFVRHGFSWQDFLDHGIEVEKVEATGDALAMKVVEIARKDTANGK